jgi:NAD(P)-dependent dehydrogenase (short-subunit alcohol dehydrogenase family)
MSSPVLLVIGAGPNIGLSLLKKFKEEGYQTAAVARTPKDSIADFVDKFYPSDLTGPPENMEEVFKQVQKDLGDPTVVVFNGTLTPKFRKTLTLIYLSIWSNNWRSLGSFCGAHTSSIVERD